MDKIAAPKGTLRRAFFAAFPHTIPILAGFLFLGIAYGIYMHALGFPWWQPTLFAIVIFGGSLEFVAGSLLLAPFAPLATFLIALMIQARHLFYGLALLDRYKGLGRKRLYLIYGLCDETFSIVFSKRTPEGVDKSWYYFFITFLNHLYWVAGVALGGLLSNLLVFNTTGVSFVMTAMFVTIFLEHALQEKQHYSALIGFLCAALALHVFGSDRFLIPTMLAILLSLGLFRTPIARKGGYR